MKFNLLSYNKIIDSTFSQDFALLRAPYPFTQLNHLSCDEARNHFGGIISLIPVLIKCATDAFNRIESKRALRSSATTKLRSEHNNNTSQQGSRIGKCIYTFNMIPHLN